MAEQDTTPGPSAPPASKVPPWLTGALGRLGLICLSGALLVLANPKTSVWPLALVGFMPALWALRDRSPLAAFGWGWLLGLICNLGGQYWAVEVLQRFGRMETWTSTLVLIAVSAYQGLVLALWAWATVAVTRRTRIPLPFAAAPALVAAELAIPFMMPWSYGLLLAPFWPAVQVAELVGGWGVAFLLMLCNALVFVVVEALWERRPWLTRGAMAAATVIVLALVFGLVRGSQIKGVTARSPALRVGLVQPNFGITTKDLRSRRWPEMIELLRRLSLQAERDGAELVIWPESAWPMPVSRSLVDDYPAGHPWQLRRGLKIPLLAGVLTLRFGEETQPMYNTAWLLDAQGKGLGRYDKNLLMPFGEYVPLGKRYPEWRKSVRKRMTESDEFNRGERPVVLTLGKARIAPLICYEDILAGHVRSYAHLKPNLLVTLSNLAWFGDSAEPEQQLLLASIRAVELRHEFLRATTTGVTAHIDALGRVQARTKLVDPPRGQLGMKPEVLVVNARLVDLGRTLFAVIGDLFAYLCAGFVLLAMGLGLVGRPRWLVIHEEEH